jgi:hypothetical protein
VKHLDPIILTGLPRGNWAADQKVRWAAQHFPGVRMITCMARDKRNHAKDGDVLVDDMTSSATCGRRMGGIFVHHKNAESRMRAGELFPAAGAISRSSSGALRLRSAVLTSLRATPAAAAPQEQADPRRGAPAAVSVTPGCARPWCRGWGGWCCPDGRRHLRLAFPS